MAIICFATCDRPGTSAPLGFPGGLPGTSMPLGFSRMPPLGAELSPRDKNCSKSADRLFTEFTAAASEHRGQPTSQQ